MCSGVGWLTFVWPPLATALSSYVLPFGASNRSTVFDPQQATANLTRVRLV